jgi:hypothetical protein
MRAELNCREKPDAIFLSECMAKIALFQSLASLLDRKFLLWRRADSAQTGPC